MQTSRSEKRIDAIATIGLLAAAIGLFAIITYVNRPRATPQGPSANEQTPAHDASLAVDSKSQQGESPREQYPPRLIARADDEASPKTYVDENGVSWTRNEELAAWSSPEARAAILKAVGLTDDDPIRDASNHQREESAPEVVASAAPTEIDATTQEVEPVAFVVRPDNWVVTGRRGNTTYFETIEIPIVDRSTLDSKWPDMISRSDVSAEDLGPPEEQYGKYTRRHPEANVYFRTEHRKALKNASTIYISRVRMGADMTGWDSMTAREFEAWRQPIVERWPPVDPRQRSMFPPDIIGAPGTPGSLPALATEAAQ